MKPALDPVLVDAVMTVAEATRRLANRLARAVPCPETTETAQLVDRLLQRMKEKLS